MLEKPFIFGKEESGFKQREKTLQWGMQPSEGNGDDKGCLSYHQMEEQRGMDLS